MVMKFFFLEVGDYRLEENDLEIFFEGKIQI